MSLAASVKRPSRELDTIYVSARSARMRLSVVVMALVIPLLVYLLLANGATLPTTLIMTALVSACIIPLQQYGLTTTELQLQRRLGSIGVVDMLTSLARVLLVSLAWLSSWANAISLTLASTVVAWVQTLLSSRQTRSTLRSKARVDVGIRRSYSRAVRQSLPAVLVMVASEQMITVLLTWSGNTSGIAEIAALSRYALAFALLNNVLGTWGASMIARTTGGRRALLKSSGRYLVLYLSSCILFLAFVTVFTTPLLDLLGSHYSGLRAEFFILMAGATISNIASFGIGAVNHARGYLRYSWTYIPLVAIWLVAGVTLVDTSTGVGAAVLTATLSLPQLVSQAIRTVHGLKEHGKGDR